MITSVADALALLVGKPRGIKIFSIMILAVEDVEDVDECTEAAPFAPGAKVDQQGPIGLNALVLDRLLFADVP